MEQLDVIILKNFVRDLISIDKESFKNSMNQLDQIFRILGQDRFVMEALPLIKKYQLFQD